MANGKKKLVRFNVQNVKYALENGTNGWESPKDLAYANSLSLDPEYEETKLYGDGQVIGILAEDKGKEGTLDLIDISSEYEKDMGRAKDIDQGLADIQARKSKRHALYYEINVFEDGEVKVVKNWLFGCITHRPSETYEQTEDSPNINTYEYPLQVMGTDLMESDGTTTYKDENGNTVKVFRLTSWPEDPDYDDFEDEVPTPKEEE